MQESRFLRRILLAVILRDFVGIVGKFCLLLLSPILYQVVVDRLDQLGFLLVLLLLSYGLRKVDLGLSKLTLKLSDF